MNTAKIFADTFIKRTTGRKASFKVNNLTLDAVKVVLKGIQIDHTAKGLNEDYENGFLRKQTNSGFYGGNDGYIPTAKGYRRILAELAQ